MRSSAIVRERSGSPPRFPPIAPLGQVKGRAVSAVSAAVHQPHRRSKERALRRSALAVARLRAHSSRGPSAKSAPASAISRLQQCTSGTCCGCAADGSGPDSPRNGSWREKRPPSARHRRFSSKLWEPAVPLCQPSHCALPRSPGYFSLDSLRLFSLTLRDYSKLCFSRKHLL